MTASETAMRAASETAGASALTSALIIEVTETVSQGQDDIASKSVITGFEMIIGSI